MILIECLDRRSGGGENQPDPVGAHEIAAERLSGSEVEATIRAVVGRVPADAVVSIRITGTLGDEHWRVLATAHLRTLAPQSMNLEVQPGVGIVQASTTAGR